MILDRSSVLETVGAEAPTAQCEPAFNDDSDDRPIIATTVPRSGNEQLETGREQVVARVSNTALSQLEIA
jgi:hypothetical protein